MRPGADTFTSQPQPAEELGKERTKQYCCVCNCFTRNQAALNFNWVIFELRSSLSNLTVLIQHAHSLHPVSFRIKINRKPILLLALTWLNLCNEAVGPTRTTHFLRYRTRCGLMSNDHTLFSKLTQRQLAQKKLTWIIFTIYIYNLAQWTKRNSEMFVQIPHIGLCIISIS